MAPPVTVQDDTGVSKKNLKWRIIEPKDFSGVQANGEDLGNEAHVWLKKMERFKKSTKLSDEEILFVAGDHLTKKAETWFNVVGIKATTWDQFVVLFKKQYLVDQEDKWWFLLQNMKQGEGDTIDDVALKMEELFELLDAKSQVFQTRTFLSAIRPNIGFEVEKDGTPTSFQDAKVKAKQIEKSFLKYDQGRSKVVVTGSTAVDLKSDFNKNHTSKIENFSDSASVTSSEMSSIVAKLEQLSINLVKLNEGVMQKSMVNKPYVPYNNVTGTRNGLTCFYCRDEGHRKYECPKYLRDQGQSANPATGSNTVPIGGDNEDSGKGNEQQ
jgi:hypothetical protein